MSSAQPKNGCAESASLTSVQETTPTPNSVRSESDPEGTGNKTPTNSGDPKQVAARQALITVAEQVAAEKAAAEKAAAEKAAAEKAAAEKAAAEKAAAEEVWIAAKQKAAEEARIAAEKAAAEKAAAKKAAAEKAAAEKAAVEKAAADKAAEEARIAAEQKAAEDNAPNNMISNMFSRVSRIRSKLSFTTRNGEDVDAFPAATVDDEEFDYEGFDFERRGTPQSFLRRVTTRLGGILEGCSF